VERELGREAQRFEEARPHPGRTNEEKRTPGETLGGPTPEGHFHLEDYRDPDRPGGRVAERVREADARRSAGEHTEG
jgi:hypothetical protein